MGDNYTHAGHFVSPVQASSTLMLLCARKMVDSVIQLLPKPIEAIKIFERKHGMNLNFFIYSL